MGGSAICTFQMEKDCRGNISLYRACPPASAKQTLCPVDSKSCEKNVPGSQFLSGVYSHVFRVRSGRRFVRVVFPKPFSLWVCCEIMRCIVAGEQANRSRQAGSPALVFLSITCRLPEYRGMSIWQGSEVWIRWRVTCRPRRPPAARQSWDHLLQIPVFSDSPEEYREAAGQAALHPCAPPPGRPLR